MMLNDDVGRVLLQLVLWLPMVGALVVAMAGNGRSDTDSAESGSRAWRIATFFAAVTFVLAAWLFIGFDTSKSSQYQFQTRIGWLPFGSDYRIAVDGLSMPLVALNALLSLSAVAGSWRIATRQSLYFSLFLALESAVAGVFTAGDLFLFFLFWELELIPSMRRSSSSCTRSPARRSCSWAFSWSPCSVPSR
jgi:NAD(P)H-quinone oxidoreductase subunit 4